MWFVECVNLREDLWGSWKDLFLIYYRLRKSKKIDSEGGGEKETKKRFGELNCLEQLNKKRS